jgi:hypothetical protein
MNEGARLAEGRWQQEEASESGESGIECVVHLVRVLITCLVTTSMLSYKAHANSSARGHEHQGEDQLTLESTKRLAKALNSRGMLTSPLPPSSLSPY